MDDRIEEITLLLLGAAYADGHFHDVERKTLTELLGKLLGAELPQELTQRIEAFTPGSFDAAACARQFANDPEDNKHKLLELIAAVHESDDEYDFAEDEYVHVVASAMDLSREALSRFTLDYEVEHLKDDLKVLRKTPPKVPV